MILSVYGTDRVGGQFIAHLELIGAKKLTPALARYALKQCGVSQGTVFSDDERTKSGQRATVAYRVYFPSGRVRKKTWVYENTSKVDPKVIAELYASNYP